MKYITINNSMKASAISLGCMRMAKLDEKSVDAIMDTAANTSSAYFKKVKA